MKKIKEFKYLPESEKVIPVDIYKNHELDKRIISVLFLISVIITLLLPPFPLLFTFLSIAVIFITEALFVFVFLHNYNMDYYNKYKKAYHTKVNKTYAYYNSKNPDISNPLLFNKIQRYIKTSNELYIYIQPNSLCVEIFKNNDWEQIVDYDFNSNNYKDIDPIMQGVFAHRINSYIDNNSKCDIYWGNDKSMSNNTITMYIYKERVLKNW